MKQILLILLIVLVLGGVGYGIFALVRSGGEDNQPAVPQPQEVVTTTPEEPEEPYVDLYPDDADRDGITNEEEASLGLDPTEFDTDLDGLADEFELNTTGTDPTNDDTDGDGLTDGQEYLIWKSDPTRADTDGDGFDDATEIDNGYNPNGDGTL